MEIAVLYFIRADYTDFDLNFGLWNLFRVSAAAACVLLTLRAPGEALSDQDVDRYNVRIGTQTFAGLYQFTTNTLLVETAEAISGLGSDIIKMYHGPEYQRQYRISLPPWVTNLVALARDEPSCRRVLNMPFRHLLLWVYPFSNAWPFDGYSSTERANDYREIYELTCYLLTNYNNSGKTFYLGHWEGDWYLLPNYNTTTNPSPTATKGMIDWLNNRQKAVDDARKGVPHAGVNVYHYAEVNRVLDATSGNTNINQRAINTVVPYVTNLDCVSYSSYDVQGASASTLRSTLDYMRAMLPTNKADQVSGERLWIGEYGWGTLDNTSQEQNSRAYIQRLLSWEPSLRFILFWEIYNNEPNRAFWLIDSNNVQVASYHLHQRFINNARLLVAQFKERNGRLPSGIEFSGLVTPMLNQPLTPPKRVAIQNSTASLATTGTVVLSGVLTQGVYGDQCASIHVYYGTQDGGTNRSGWQHSQFAGLNTNFNPATFSATVGDLQTNAYYYFRFYATNSNAEAWAPDSDRFSTSGLNPADYGSRMKIGLSSGNSAGIFESPVLVNLSTNLSGFSYRQFASSTGGDLRFADAAGLTPLAFEIDEWNTNGVTTVWVRVPALPGTSGNIWAYWGNPLATTLPSGSSDGSVWSSDHLAVYHLKESRLPMLDSTMRHPIASGIVPLSWTARVGRGAAFNGNSHYLNCGVVDLGNTFTLSAWIRLDSTATNIQTICANKSGGYNTAGFALFVNSYGTADGKVILETGDGIRGMSAGTISGVVSRGSWYHIAASVDRAGGSARIFVDGLDRTDSSAIQSNFSNQATVNIGRFPDGGFYFKGLLDEVRLDRRVRSGAGLSGDWSMVASNTNIVSFGEVSRQQPELSLEIDRDQAILRWPAQGVGFALYRTSEPAWTEDWVLVTNSPNLTNSQWQVVQPLELSHSQFYQLRSQL